MSKAHCKDCGKELKQEQQAGIKPSCPDCFKKAMQGIGYTGVETQSFGYWMKRKSDEITQ